MELSWALFLMSEVPLYLHSSALIISAGIRVLSLPSGGQVASHWMELSWRGGALSSEKGTHKKTILRLKTGSRQGLECLMCAEFAGERTLKMVTRLCYRGTSLIKNNPPP